MMLRGCLFFASNSVSDDLNAKTFLLIKTSAKLKDPHIMIGKR